MEHGLNTDGENLVNCLVYKAIATKKIIPTDDEDLHLALNGEKGRAGTLISTNKH